MYVCMCPLVISLFIVLPVLGYEATYLVYDRKRTNIQLFHYNPLSGNFMVTVDYQYDSLRVILTI